MGKLLSTFDFYSSCKFVFVKPGGNYGDFLIYRGAEKLAREAGIEFKSVSHQEFMETRYDANTVIYLHGSGGYNPWGCGTPMEELKKAVQTHEGILIQGPSTVHADRAFLQEHVGAPLEQTTLQGMHFFARERTSYEVLNEILPERVELQVDHDTALHLRAEDLPQTEVASAGHTFFAIRGDKEREDVIDAPKPFRMWYDPVPVSQSFGDWVRHHAQAEKIVTNRLHSAVLSPILGKRVTLLPNSYHKNRSAYEFSLAHRGVEWQDKIESTALDRLLGVFPARIRRSYRVARGINRVRRALAT